MMSERKGHLKAYTIFEKLTKDYPDEYIGYGALSEICGDGYFEKPEEQEKYALKAFEIFEKNKSTKTNDIHNQRYMYSLIIQSKRSLGKYHEVLKLTSELIKTDPNNTFIHNHAVILNKLERFEESIDFCKRELFVTEDETVYLLLGENFYSLKNYKQALVYFKKTLSFINAGIRNTVYTDEDNRMLTSHTKEGWVKKKKIENVFIPIIDCYFRLGEYLNARAVWTIANNEFPNNKMLLAWDNIISIMIDAKRQNEAAELALNKLTCEFEEEKRIASQRKGLVRKWAQELMKIQGLDLDEKSLDTNWEEYEEQFDEIINKMFRETEGDIQYSRIKEYFENQYSGLHKKSIEFLSTAEYLFLANKGNTIDFAPIMVEYCKVVELELRIILNNKKLTLGQSLRHIEKLNIDPLVYNLHDLNLLYQHRNGSAHSGTSTKEKVEKVRNILFDKNLLMLLCKIK